MILFVAGDAPNSARALGNLRGALEQRNLDQTVVRVVDTLRDPASALEYRIFATPALMPLDGAGTTVYGDLSDAEALARFLARIFDGDAGEAGD